MPYFSASYYALAAPQQRWGLLLVRVLPRRHRLVIAQLADTARKLELPFALWPPPLEAAGVHRPVLRGG